VFYFAKNNVCEQCQPCASERLVFVTPAFISVFLISFVTFWGAKVSPAFTVVFICCYVSYGWVKGIHSAVFALFVGIPRWWGCVRMVETTNWWQRQPLCGPRDESDTRE
jgi:hypothetical protein